AAWPRVRPPWAALRPRRVRMQSIQHPLLRLVTADPEPVAAGALRPVRGTAVVGGIDDREPAAARSSTCPSGGLAGPAQRRRLDRSGDGLHHWPLEILQ